MGESAELYHSAMAIHLRDAGFAAQLQRLEEEKACREDMVRDMRSEFDTEFLRKQAEEFELRERAHQRSLDKYKARITELEERLAEPKTYTGGEEHLGRIRSLEARIQFNDAKLDDALSRCIHFENVADDQLASMRKYWHFITNGLLVRIRDLTAGKDPKSLPLLPQMPPAPQPPRPFDPAAPRQTRQSHSDPLDDDLELGLDDDFGLDDLDVAATGPGDIDLGSDDDL